MPPPRLPLPPIPPAGGPPPVATQGDEDPQSPTVMLQSYLRAKGMPLTAENMQRVLTENARGSMDIPGLVNDVPATTDPGVGQSGNLAGKVEQAPSRGRLPTPPIPPDNPPPPAGADTTNQPAISRSITDILDPRILGPAILAGTGVGAGYYLGGRRPPSGANTSAQPSGPGGTPEGPSPTGGPEEPLRLPAPVQTGNRFDVQQPQVGGPPSMLRLPAPQANVPPPGPVSDAISQAVAPAAGMIPRAVGPNMPTGVNAPGVNPNTVGAPQLPTPPRPPIAGPPPTPVAPAPVDVVPPGMMRTPGGGLTNIPSPGFRAPVRPGVGRMRLRF